LTSLDPSDVVARLLHHWGRIHVALRHHRQGSTRLQGFTIIKREGRKDFWTDIGIGYLHNDGAGLNILLQATPLDGKLIPSPFFNEGRKPTVPAVLIPTSWLIRCPPVCFATGK